MSGVSLESLGLHLTGTPEELGLYKTILGVVGELSPETTRTCLEKIRAIVIDTETKLKGVTDVMFEMAIRNSLHAETYANLCRYLLTVKVQSETSKGVSFRELLLTRCQREFWMLIDRYGVKRKKGEPDSLSETEKQRILGNIGFMGELFKLKIIKEPIMHDCVFKLMKVKNELTLECACALLTSMGQLLGTDKHKGRTEQYIQQMKKVVKENKMSPRCTGLLQDVIDLRDNGWQPISTTTQQAHGDACNNHDINTASGACAS